MRRPVDIEEIVRTWELPEDFLTEHWRRSHALGRTTPDAPGLIDDPVGLLGQGMRSDRVSISTDGRMHHPAEFTSARTVAGRPVPDIVDPDRVRALLDAGATAVLANAELWLPPVTRLAGSLADSFGCEVEAHVFLTGAHHRGLTPHADGEDNFLIQLQGTKTWSLWHSESVEPAHVSAEGLGEPTATMTLTPGEVLYIPIGWIHAATAGDDGSAHVTYQVVPKSLTDAVLDQLAEELEPLLGKRLHRAPSGAPLTPEAAKEFAHRLVELLTDAR